MCQIKKNCERLNQLQNILLLAFDCKQIERLKKKKKYNCSQTGEEKSSSDSIFAIEDN